MEVVRKRSKKRDAILTKIKSTKSHPSAEWVYRQLKPEYPDLSLGTVYRNIAVLKEEGQVITAHIVNGQERLDGCTHSHPHFVCDICGAVIDGEVELPEVEPYLSEGERQGFKIERQELVFHGKCSNCLKAC